MSDQKTRADRLNAVVAQVFPNAIDENGNWKNTHPSPGEDSSGKPLRHSGAPYVIETLEGGRTRIKVTSEDGDTVAGVGKDIDEALDALESKVKGGQS